MLEKYNQAFPGCAERIVTMAESQLSHRQGLESNHLQGTQKAERFGQIGAFILALSAILGGVYLISTGKDAQGLVAIISALTCLTGVFIYGRRAQSQERQKKRDELRNLQLPLPYEEKRQS